MLFYRHSLRFCSPEYQAKKLTKCKNCMKYGKNATFFCIIFLVFFCYFVKAKSSCSTKFIPKCTCGNLARSRQYANRNICRFEYQWKKGNSAINAAYTSFLCMKKGFACLRNCFSKPRIAVFVVGSGSTLAGSWIQRPDRTGFRAAINFPFTFRKEKKVLSIKLCSLENAACFADQRKLSDKTGQICVKIAFYYSYNFHWHKVCRVGPHFGKLLITSILWLNPLSLPLFTSASFIHVPFFDRMNTIHTLRARCWVFDVWIFNREINTGYFTYHIFNLFIGLLFKLNFV